LIVSLQAIQYILNNVNYVGVALPCDPHIISKRRELNEYVRLNNK